MAQPTTFDPVAYKTTTRDQWQSAAEAWHRWGPTIEAWLGEATEAMLEMTGTGPGKRVLDVTAGAGGQTLAAARRVGPKGHVLATDIAPSILEFAASEARRCGVARHRAGAAEVRIPQGLRGAVRDDRRGGDEVTCHRPRRPRSSLHCLRLPPRRGRCDER